MKDDYTVAITGSNGFIGKCLQKIFKRVVALNHNDSVDMMLKKLKGVDVVINLAGAPIVKRWNKKYKKVLYKSRIETTNKLVKAVNQSDVKYFISASAIGIYPSDKAYDETSTEYGDDFLAKLCIDWEAEAIKCSKDTAILRLGVVLGKDGGALQKMLLPFKLGLGGVIGDGKMITSWIDISDLLSIYKFLIAKRAVGVYNAVSPHPVSNRVFTKALGKALNKPTFIPLPIFALKLIYAQASSVLTDSKEIYPTRLKELGFKYRYDTIDKSLASILAQDNRQ